MKGIVAVGRPGQADTRARIEEVALELFVTQGYSNTSLQQIADRIGVTKAALYYHFPSKSDLVLGLVSPLKHDVEDMLAEAEAAECTDLQTVLAAFFDTLADHRGIYMAMLNDASLLGQVDMGNWLLEWLQRLLRLLVGDDPTLEQRVSAVVAIGGVARTIVLLDHAPVEEVRSNAVDAAVRALDTDMKSKPTDRRQF
jgi:AcrR family transcriptional regulator